MSRQNCWEFKQYGRQPGGAKVYELGICPAVTDTSAEGVNDGQRAGRICWAVVGTLCGGPLQGTFAQKQFSCLACAFFQRVKQEQGSTQFQTLKPGQVYQEHA